MKSIQKNMVPALVAVLLVSAGRAEEEVRYPEDPWGDDTPVPMAEYKPSVECPGCPLDFRVGDCWQCFAAKGKMCLDKEGKGLFNHMETTKPGVGFCCSPSSTSEFCTTGTQHGHGGSTVEILCSPESFIPADQAAASPYKNVITGDRNYQMFAYCPNIN